MKWQKLYNIQLILLKREQTLFLTNKSDFQWLFIEFYIYVIIYYYHHYDNDHCNDITNNDIIILLYIT